MRLRAVALATTALLMMALLPASAVAAPAAVATATLPDAGFNDILVNGATKHIYVTSGGAYSTVRVYTYGGAPVATLTQQFGASGMALSADKTRLYVALRQASAVSEIDTATLTETRRWSTGTSHTPFSVAVAAGRVWIGAKSSVSGGVLLSIDPSEALSGLRTDATGMSDGSILAAGANTVAAIPPGGSYLTVFNVAGGTVQSTRQVHTGAANAQEIAVSPDGSTVLLAAGAPYYIQAFSTTDLSRVASYATGHYPRAVAVSGDGKTLLTGTDHSVPTLRVWDWMGPEPTETFSPGAIWSGGLAINNDGSVVAAVTGGHSYPFVLTIYSGAATTVTFTTDQREAFVGDTLHLSGALAGAGPLGDRPLEVTRTAGDGAEVELPPVTTASDGTFTFDDTPPAAGDYVYTASFAGDGILDPSSATHAVAVNRIPVQLHLDPLPSRVDAGTSVTVTATLHGTAGGLTIDAAWPGAATSRRLGSGEVDDGGGVSGVHVVRRNTVITAHYGGSATHAPTTARHVIRAATVIDASLRNHAAIVQRQDRQVHVFDRGVVPLIRADVTPAHPGACLNLRLRAWDGLTWGGLQTWCQPVEWDGSVRATPPQALRPGGYRITAVLSADSDHAAGWSDPLFLRVRR